MTAIMTTTWYGFPALMLESGEMRVIIVPDLGAKIVSIYDKAHRHEWLVPPMRPLKQTAYGADFVSQDMSGWDEMMPTIVSCTVQGVHLPDHGEVWSVPWQVESLVGEVSVSVESRLLPYRLKRSAVLSAPDCLELRYTLTHTGAMAIHYLWAAHPQFAADAHTRIVLPAEVTQVLNVVAGDAIWGDAGKQHSWPAAQGADGQLVNLNRVRPAQQHACRKFYIPPEQTVSSASLVQEEPGCELRLTWSAVELPYLGLWVDEGVYNANPVAAPEPSTGYYDSLERAIDHGKVTILEPGEEKNWTLKVIVANWQK
jgi:galactose mutarotase-like enzyme